MTKIAMIKVVAFDLGGVYFSEGKSVAVNKLEKEYAYDRNIIAPFFKCPKSLDLRKGLISDEDFWAWAKKELPAEYDVQLIRDTWYDSYTPDNDIVQLVQNLRGKYRLMIFSENIESRVEYLDRKYDFRKLFDAEVYSYEKHALKYYAPEQNKDFYLALITDADCEAEEILAIDDRENAVTMLRSLGVGAIQYKQGDINNLEGELQKYGVQIGSI